MERECVARLACRPPRQQHTILVVWREGAGVGVVGGGGEEQKAKMRVLGRCSCRDLSLLYSNSDNADESTVLSGTYRLL